MNVYVDKDKWTKLFKNQEIVDVAIRDKDILYFLTRKKMSNDEASRLMDADIPSRIIAIYLDDPGPDGYGYQEITGMSFPVLGVSRDPFPRPCGLMSSRGKDGDVWPMGGGGNGPMEHIAPGQWHGTKRLKCIDGYTYSISTCHEIYLRKDAGVWEKIQGFPELPKKEEVLSNTGFNDLDQFAPNDMYAVGGLGDVWHFDGQQWKQMGFPSNEQLATVTCAGDGKVYITGEAGNLWVGEKSTWKLVYKGSSSILWNDALWFQDKLWLASDYHLRVWDGKEMQAPIGDDGDSVPISGHMDAYDGVLVVASLEFVMLYDGHTWRRIVAPYFK